MGGSTNHNRPGISSRSSAAPTPLGSDAENHMPARPSNQSSQRNARALPVTGREAVQFGTAVSRNPQTAATAQPKTISWPCHQIGDASVGAAPPTREHAQPIDDDDRRVATDCQEEGPEPVAEERARKGSVIFVTHCRTHLEAIGPWEAIDPRLLRIVPRCNCLTHRAPPWRSRVSCFWHG